MKIVTWRKREIERREEKREREREREGIGIKIYREIGVSKETKYRKDREEYFKEEHT